MDDRRPLVHRDGKTMILDTMNGARRDAGVGLVTPLASTCRDVHCVLVSNQTEATCGWRRWRSDE
jgi:hypothetical protein